MLTLQQIRDLIREEEALDRDFIHLTSNETLLSPLAASVLSSPLGSRYLLEHGDMRQDSPSRLNGFVFRGLDGVNAIEHSAAEVCRQLFGATYAEFRCLSGWHAMQTTLVSLTQPGDKIMRFGVADGGHFATETMIKAYGRTSCTYVFDRERLSIDMDATAEVIQREKPKLLYLDAMNYLFPFPIRELREAAGETPILYDASHTLGLIAGGQFQNPLNEGADILQANTHKTLFGPQKGIILSRNRELMERISYMLSQGLVSSQHTASLLSLCIALHESLYWGRDYARDVVGNARYLAQAMAGRGLPVLARSDGTYTDNHHFYINLTDVASASHAVARLLEARLSAQRVAPFRDTDAIRVGVQDITRRGIRKEDLERIADWFADIVFERVAPGEIAPRVIALARRYPHIYYWDGAPPLDAQPSMLASETPSGMDEALNVDTARRAKQRWVGFERVGGAVAPLPALLEEIRALASLSGAFPNQSDASGNISARDGDDVLVTTSGCYIKDLRAQDFVRLIGLDHGDTGQCLHYLGDAVPSSESLMHYLIYQYTDAGAVAHTHYLLTNHEAEALRVAIVLPQEYASVALAEAVAEASRHCPVIYVQKHGLVFHAATPDACCKLIEDFIAKRAQV